MEIDFRMTVILSPSVHSIFQWSDAVNDDGTHQSMGVGAS